MVLLRDDDGVQRPLSQIADAPLHVLDAAGVQTNRDFDPENEQREITTVVLGGRRFHQHQVVMEQTPLDTVEWVVVQCVDNQFGTAVHLANPPSWDRTRTVGADGVRFFEPQVAADGTPVWGY